MAVARLSVLLNDAVHRFNELELATCDVGAPSLYHRVGAAIHTLLSALTIADQLEELAAPYVQEALEPVRRFHRRSDFGRRVQDWPRGYPGDFETIEMLLRGSVCEPVGGDPIGFALDRFLLGTSLANQHRFKVLEQARLVSRLVSRRAGARILSIACGGSQDMECVAESLRDGDAHVVLNDIDSDAIAASRARLAKFAIPVTVIQGDAFRCIRAFDREGPYDVVLAGGLFDYLSDKAAVLLLKRLRRLCRQDGLLFFTNIGPENPYRIWLTAIAKWPLQARTARQLQALCLQSGADAAAISVKPDPTGISLLVTVSGT